MSVYKDSVVNQHPIFCDFLGYETFPKKVSEIKIFS